MNITYQGEDGGEGGGAGEEQEQTGTNTSYSELESQARLQSKIQHQERSTRACERRMHDHLDHDVSSSWTIRLRLPCI